MIWDRFIRLFHWSLAAGIALNYWLLEGGDEPHEWLGYALLALVGARIVWGFIGPDNARFKHFVVGPKRVLQSIQNFSADYAQHKGHSPLAGWMILFLLFLVTLVGVSGWMQELDMFWGEDWVETLHEVSGHVLIAAAGVHILAVIIIQRRYRLALIQAMLWKSDR